MYDKKLSIKKLPEQKTIFKNMLSKTSRKIEDLVIIRLSDIEKTFEAYSESFEK